MNDPKQPNAQTSTQKPAQAVGANSASSSQNPAGDSVTFMPNDSFEPPSPAKGEREEDIQDAAHEKMLDIDSELQGADLSGLELKVVEPTLIAQSKPASAPAIPPPPAPAGAPVQVQGTPAISQPPKSAPAPVAAPTSAFTPPGFIPKESVQKQVVPPVPTETKAPATSPIHQPRSFASLTPLMMREPVEPQMQQAQKEEAPEVAPIPVPVPAEEIETVAPTASEAGVASFVPPETTAPAPTAPPMRAPIPIQQEIPGHEIIPGAVSRQPEAPTQAKAVTAEAPKNLSVLDKIREQSASVLHPLRTYQSDAQVSIRENNTSLVTAAAAEERRRTQTAPILVRPAYKPTMEAPKHHYLRTILLVLGASLFLAGGVGVVAYVLIPKSTDLINQPVITERPIEVDESIELQFAGLSHDQLMQLLTNLRDKTDLSLGLIREIYFTLPTEDGKKRLATVEEVLPKLTPRIPAELVRTLSPSFLVGVHVYDGNQGFLILKTTSYEQAFSAMLSWENTMRDDLMPFVDRRPGPRLTTETVATSAPVKVLSSEFVDVVVRNHDARALYDRFGNLIFLYSFLDRNTIFIGTNEYSLSEAVIRTRGR